MKKYAPGRITTWTNITPLLSNRQVNSIKRRYQYLEDTIRSTITRFLHVFEKGYMEAERRGEVKPLEMGQNFDLVYCFNWFRESGLEVGDDDTCGEGMKIFQESEDMMKLPRDLVDLRMYFHVEELEQPRGSWQVDYWAREAASSVRRQECLYSETFMVPVNPSPGVTVDEKAEFRESLVKVLSSRY
jgi:hypothetical protein